MAMKRLKDLIPKADHRNAKIVVSIVAIFIIVAILALGIYPDLFKMQFGL